MVVDDTLEAELKRKGHALSSIPNAGEEIVLDQTANTSRGAETADITDEIHPTFADVAVKATAAIPGLRLAGVDILADDLSRPAKPGNHIVVEINSYPGIRSHHFPDRGTPRDVAKIIVGDTLKAVDALATVAEARPSPQLAGIRPKIFSPAVSWRRFGRRVRGLLSA